MTLLWFFAGLIFASAFALVVLSIVQSGRVRNWRDWIPAIVAVLVIASILSVTDRAQSFAYTEVFFGLEYPDGDGHPACVKGDSQITSNIGIDQSLWQSIVGPVSVAIDGT